jgi:hypothetical protein
MHSHGTVKHRVKRWLLPALSIEAVHGHFRMEGVTDAFQHPLACHKSLP